MKEFQMVEKKNGAKNKLRRLVFMCILAASAPAMSAIYMVMPQDGGTSMQTGLSKAEGSDGWRPEMPSVNEPVSIVLNAGKLPDTSLGQNYSFTIPLSWTTVLGDESFDESEVSYSLIWGSQDTPFTFSENNISGTIVEKSTYSLDLIANYKGKKSNTVTLEISADDWHMDERGVVFCLGAPKGKVKTLNGKTYISSGSDKTFAANNYSNACTSNLKDMSVMPWPDIDTFNGDISHWDTSAATDMGSMFRFALAFNKSVSNFDTSNVMNMSFLFSFAENFNQSLSNFNTSNVTNMYAMFYQAHSFNQPVSNFDTRKVTDMRALFERAYSFNQPVSNLDTSKATSMYAMFYQAHAFNQPLYNFDTSKVIDMNYMFSSTGVFDQDLSGWCVIKINSTPYDFDHKAEGWNKEGRQPVWGTCPEN